MLYEATKRMPWESFIYYADTLHVPYGSKPKELVRDYILTSVRAIMEEPVKALVIACNTATSVAIQDLRRMYRVPIIGMEPAVKPAVEMNRSNGRRVLVTATPLTLKESKFHELVKRVDDRSIVDTLPLPELVEFCEQLIFDGEEVEVYFREKFAPFDFEEYGTIVLGCTHFTYYRPVLSRLLPPHMKIIDGGRGTVNRLMDVLAVKGTEWGVPFEREELKQGITLISSDDNPAYVRKMEEALQRYAKMQI